MWTSCGYISFTFHSLTHTYYTTLLLFYTPPHVVLVGGLHTLPHILCCGQLLLYTSHNTPYVVDYYPTHLIFVVHSFFCTALVLYTYLVVFFVLCTLCTHYTLLVSVLYTASHGISHSFPHNTQHLWLVIVGSLHHSAWLLYQSIHTVYSTQHRPLSGTLHKVYYLFTQRLSHNWPQAR